MPQEHGNTKAKYESNAPQNPARLQSDVCDRHHDRRARQRLAHDRAVVEGFTVEPAFAHRQVFDIDHHDQAAESRGAQGQKGKEQRRKRRPVARGDSVCCGCD